MGGQMRYIVLDPIDTYRPPQALEMVEMDSSIDFDRLSDLVQPSNIYIYIYLCNFNM